MHGERVSLQDPKVLPRASGSAKVLVSFKLREMAWMVAAAGVRSRHPEWSKAEIDRAVREAMTRART